MYDLLKRHAVHVLRAAGFSLARVAAQANIPKTTAVRLAREPAVTEAMIVAAAEARAGMGRPSVARPYETAIQGILNETPTLPGVEILHRLKAQGYAGGKSAIYALVAALRPVPVPPPRPAVTKTMSAPSKRLKILSVSSIAAFRPISGFAPAPSPLVSFSPI